MRPITLLTVCMCAGLSVISPPSSALPLFEVAANRQSDVIQLNSEEPVDITITMAPEELNGVQADWWLFATSSWGNFTYDVSQGGWVVGRPPWGSASYQGSLIDFFEFNVLNNFKLPDGDYKVYFGFDQNKDGIRDLDWQFDTVKINVNSKSVPEATVAENAFVLQTMREQYLWVERLPDLDYSRYASPEALLSHLVFDELDRWSYITSADSFVRWFSDGEYIGIGFGAGYDSSGRYRIKDVHNNSPADRYGLRRGDGILKVNGKTIEEIMREDLWDDIFGPRKIGVKVTMRVLNASGIEREVLFTKDRVTVDSVPQYYLTSTPMHKFLQIKS